MTLPDSLQPTMTSRNCPLISCICVTRAKPELLRRSVACYLGQTYANREMIILFEDDDRATVSAVESDLPANHNIKLVQVPAHPKRTLGQLRNLAIKKATGEFICQWDDDDWYHQRRLEQQYETMRSEGRSGSVLTRWLLFDALNARAYISHMRLWEGSILCKKKVLQRMPYEDKDIGEDTATIEQLASTGQLHFLNTMPVLYIYIYHGRNSWSREHWTSIFNRSLRLSEQDARIIEAVVQGRCPVSEGSSLLNHVMERIRIDSPEQDIASFTV